MRDLVQRHTKIESFLADFVDSRAEAMSSVVNDPVDPLAHLLQYFIGSQGPTPLWTIAVGVWIVMEICFFVAVVFFLAPLLQKRTKPAPFPKGMTPLALIRRILSLLDSLESYDFEKFLCGWFNGVKFDDIYSGNVNSFIAWAMFAKKYDQLNPTDRADVDLVRSEFCQRFRVTFKPGFNPAITHVSMNLQEVPYIHRPLCVYVFNGIVEVFVAQHYCLRVSGFQYAEVKGVGYWIKQAKPGCSEPPLLFFHGITTGWLLYLFFLRMLVGGRACVLIDVNATKINSLKFGMPSRETTTQTIQTILNRHEFGKCSVVGHSFGTIVAGWFAQAYPQQVGQITLLDPVTLLLGLPDVARNFLYRRPSTFMEFMIYLAAARELTISHTLHRNFWWYENLLWLEDLDPSIGVVVVVSERDDILNARTMMEYVRGCAATRQAQRNKALVSQHEARGREESDSGGVGSEALQRSSLPAPIMDVLLPHQFHGQFLFSYSTQVDLINAIRQCEKVSLPKVF